MTSSNTVTELSAATGAVVQVISGSSYQFNGPYTISSDGTHVWVGDGGGSVTEMNAATGALVRVISGSSMGFNGYAAAMFSDGTHVWVANSFGNSVAELNAATGALAQVTTGSSYKFGSSYSICSDGTHVWVLNGSSVTEMSAATGALVQVITGSSYGFNGPTGIACDGTHVWVVNEEPSEHVPNPGSVTELNAATGALVQVISGASYGFATPVGISCDGTHVWVANDGTPALAPLARSPS